MSSSGQTTESPKKVGLLGRYLNRKRIREAWNKYSLIIVGNIVFFALLYFISYRPNNDESRAAELLSLAQSAETQGLDEAAFVLYEKITQDYHQARAFKTAKTRLPKLRKQLAKEEPTQPQSCRVECEDLELDEMLRQGPARYTASFLARQYPSRVEDQPKIHTLIRRYLVFSLKHERAALETLRSDFKDPALAKEFFAPKPACVLRPDWIWDDFSVRNDNFYDWHNVFIELEVKQAGRTEKKSVRLEELKAGRQVPVLEFRVGSDAGIVTCRMKVRADEGAGEIIEDL